jgi:hypothetical protein
MSRSRLLLIGALVGFVACSDREDSSAVAGPRPSAGISKSSATATSAGESSICTAYKADRDETAAQLARNPNDADLKADLASEDRIVASACN